MGVWPYVHAVLTVSHFSMHEMFNICTVFLVLYFCYLKCVFFNKLLRGLWHMTHQTADTAHGSVRLGQYMKFPSDTARPLLCFHGSSLCFHHFYSTHSNILESNHMKLNQNKCSGVRSLLLQVVYVIQQVYYSCYWLIFTALLPQQAVFIMM